MGLIKKPFLFRKKGKTDDYDPSVAYAGVWPFVTNDPVLNRCAYNHDKDYEEAAANPGTLSLVAVDDEFRHCMWAAIASADISGPEKLAKYDKADLWYCLAHIWGLKVRRSLFK